jgi:uncharacterized protein (TIGR02266 family)
MQVSGQKEDKTTGAMRQQILVVGAETEPLQRVLPVLEKHSVDIHRKQAGEAALNAIQNLSVVDLVFVSYPLPDMEFGDFVMSVTGIVSPRRPPQIVVLVTKADVAGVAGHVGHGVQVLPADLPDNVLERATAKFLRKAPRPATRIMVKMVVKLGGVGKVLRMAQSVDISASGMLIRTNEHYPLGSEVALEFALPGAREPVHAEAQVVRHAIPDREGVTGMGLKFTGLAPEHKTRLERYLRGQVVDEDS